jgi:hypothetical protein
VASPDALSIRQIAATIGDLLGKDVRFERIGATEPRPIIPDLTRLAGLYDLARFRRFAAGMRDILGAETMTLIDAR